MNFKVIPAVDLKGGRCVRLLQGKASAETVFSNDPVAMAERWAAEGAPRLHVVDLDGAFGGGPVQTAIIRKIAHTVSIPVEAGGACTVIYTDIARDGTQGGPNMSSTEAVARAAGIPVFASGGVGSLEDIRQLAALAGVEGVIVGRALYTGAVSLRAALAEAR